jgi:hypothetical protein
MKKLILLFLIVLTSCASRQVQVDKIDIKKDSVVETKVIVTTIENKIKTDSTNIVTTIDDSEITITPIDTYKEIIVEGKVYKNVVLKIKKNKANTLYTNNKKESETKHIDSTAKSIVIKKEDIDGKSKVIDKKESITGNIVVYSLLLLLIIAIVIFVRKVYKAYTV